VEESIGKVWDRFLSKKTDKSYENERVYFADNRKALSLFFRLLGGSSAKELQVTDKRPIQTSRSVLDKISGARQFFFLAHQDEEGLYLPASLAYFPTKRENELHYFWLVALATCIEIEADTLEKANFKATKILLMRYPGFVLFLSQAQDILQKSNQLEPNPLWMYPSLYTHRKFSDFEDEVVPDSANKPEKNETLQMKKQAEKIDDKKETDGLLMFLPDSILSIMEQVNVDRSEDDSFDEDALYNAEDLDEITLGRKKANLSSRIKMDLDIATHSSELYPIGEGHFMDEWDYSKERYLENYVCIKPIIDSEAVTLALPKHLKKMVKKIENELDLIQLDRIKRNHLPYGDEVNMDTWIEYLSHQNRSGHHQKFYHSYERKTRDMATLILADISLSTEAGITQEIRIIDMIKDGLMVFSESLFRLEDRFAIYAFSSLKNSNVRFHLIKNFNERYGGQVRGRIDNIKPGYYTRMGAAIRNGATILNKQGSSSKLLLIISDGKPNDVDRYDGRYGIEDTKKAISEVKKLGITPFCITIDLEAKSYLSYLFGKHGYVVVRDSQKLPKALPQIYMNLTQ
jgi:nitric oxide reductase NorD protein